MTNTIDYIINQANIALAESDYELAKLNADFLGITLDEYYDFVADMDGLVTDDLTADELEQMYVEYCQEYEIPCSQIPDYICYDMQGW